MPFDFSHFAADEMRLPAGSTFEEFCEAANIRNPGMAKLFLDHVCSCMRQSRTVGLSRIVRAAAANEKSDPYLYFLWMTANDYRAGIQGMPWKEPERAETYYLINLMQSKCKADATAESMRTLAADAEHDRDLYRVAKFQIAEEIGVGIMSVEDFED